VVHEIVFGHRCGATDLIIFVLLVALLTTEEAGWVSEQPAHTRFRLVNTTFEGPPTRQSLHAFMRSLLKVRFNFLLLLSSEGALFIQY
jgi:hypothetical protein